MTIGGVLLIAPARRGFEQASNMRAGVMLEDHRVDAVEVVADLVEDVVAVVDDHVENGGEDIVAFGLAGKAFLAFLDELSNRECCLRSSPARSRCG